MKRLISRWLVVVLALTTAGFVVAQQPEPDKKPSFEVVSIRRSTPGSPMIRPTILNPRRITVQNTNLVVLTYFAYGAGMGTAVRVSGGPDWTNRDGFDIQGLAPQDSNERDFRRMVQSMLEERFSEKVRVEKTMVDALGLFLNRTDGKLGPNVEEWRGTCQTWKLSPEDDPTLPRCGGGYAPRGILLEGVTMFNVAEILSLPMSRSLLGTIVTDHTGLTGRFDMKLDYAFPPAGQPLQPGSPALGTALKEQWGLKVEPAKGPFTTVTIESAEHPTEN